MIARDTYRDSAREDARGRRRVRRGSRRRIACPAGAADRRRLAAWRQGMGFARAARPASKRQAYPAFFACAWTHVMAMTPTMSWADAAAGQVVHRGGDALGDGAVRLGLAPGAAPACSRCCRRPGRGRPSTFARPATGAVGSLRGAHGGDDGRRAACSSPSMRELGGEVRSAIAAAWATLAGVVVLRGAVGGMRQDAPRTGSVPMSASTHDFAEFTAMWASLLGVGLHLQAAVAEQRNVPSWPQVAVRARP